MITICSWCQSIIKPDDGRDSVLRVSHGLCAACAVRVEAEMRAAHKRLLVRVDRSMPSCQRVGGL